MVDVAVYGHGGREKGSSSAGTYIVPKGVTIYFFVADGELFVGTPADDLFNVLADPHPKDEAVRYFATDVKKAYDKIPNYKCVSGPNLSYPAGVYQVGMKPDKGLLVKIPAAPAKRLSDIIGGMSGKGTIGSRIYWLCCREVETGANSVSAKPKGSRIIANQKVNWTGQAVIKDTGWKPSKVKEKKGQWQPKSPF